MIKRVSYGGRIQEHDATEAPSKCTSSCSGQPAWLAKGLSVNA